MKMYFKDGKINRETDNYEKKKRQKNIRNNEKSITINVCRYGKRWKNSENNEKQQR